MYPPECDYRRADSVAEALDLLASTPSAEPIAGGQELVDAMKRGDRAPTLLVDVERLDELAGVERRDGTVSVGALVEHATLSGADLGDTGRCLVDAAARTGDRQVRNRGTLGGNLAAAEPGSDPPAAALAADARVEVRGPDGRRSVPMDGFVRGPGETALGDDELIAAVRVPAWADGSAYVRKTHPATGYAAVGVAAAVAVAVAERDSEEDENGPGGGATGGRIERARVATTGVADRPIRLPAVEDRLAGRGVDAPTAAVATEAADASERAVEAADADPTGDRHVSAAYRVALLPTRVERAVGRAVERAVGRPGDRSGSGGGRSENRGSGERGPGGASDGVNDGGGAP